MGSVRKKGSKWYFSIELPPENGKRRRIERAGGKTKKEALQKMALLEAEIFNKGGYKEKSKMLFNELMDIWFKEHVELNCSKNTQRLYRLEIKNHIAPDLGDYTVISITTRAIQDFLNNKKKEGCSKQAVGIFKNIIVSSLNYAVFPLELIESNPARYAKMPKIDVEEKNKVLSLDDYNAILKAAENYPTLCNVFKLLFNTGMRISEALALQWEDIDFSENTIHIKHSILILKGGGYILEDPKTKSSVRDIYMNDVIVQVLKNQRKVQNENKLKYGEYYIISNLVFTRENGEYMHRNLFRYNLKKIKEESGVDFTFHSFRHTHATMLIESGANMKEVQKRLGHSDIATTMNIYVDSTSNSKKDTMDRFNQFIKKTSDI